MNVPNKPRIIAALFAASVAVWIVSGTLAGVVVTLFAATLALTFVTTGEKTTKVKFAALFTLFAALMFCVYVGWYVWALGQADWSN